MRTATIAAALVIALAACGSDGGLSLTEPHQIAACDLATSGFDFVGEWTIDQWGCIGRSSPGGAMNCDPVALPWVDGDRINITSSDNVSFTVTLPGGTMTVDTDGRELSGSVSAATDLLIAGCADGSAFVLAYATATSDSFGAFAHRR